MPTEICFCGYCLENSTKHFSLDIQNNQWLELLGEMMEAATEGLKREQSSPSGCNQRLSAV